jgi:flagellar protein FliS
MYATATGSTASMFSQRNISNTYRSIDVETGVNGASPHQLTTLLFNGALESMVRARGAMMSGQIEIKGKAIGKAISIIEEGLRGNLNLSEGGELAQRLNDLYQYMTTRLFQANLQNDPAALDECMKLLKPIRDAWVAIAPTSDAPASTAAMRIQA